MARPEASQSTPIQRLVGAPARRGRLWPAAALAVAIGAALVVVAGRGSHHDGIAPIGSAPVARAYHVVYAVQSGRLHTTERLWVNRPFESEEVLSTGSHVVSRLGRQSLDASGTPAVFEVAPAVAQFDQRVDAVIAAAPRRVLEVRGTHTVAGYACRVVRTHDVLAAAFAGTPTSADHVDTCVSAAGVVLAQTTVRGGTTVNHAVATRVVLGPAAVAGHRFATPGTHLAEKQGGGRIVTVSDDSRPPGQDFWQLASPPAGFSHLGRFAVVAPSGPNDPVVTTIDDVYLRGADMVVVEQGGTASGLAMAPADGTAVSLGGLGSGRVTVSPVATSVAALLPGHTGFVRVTGTLPPSQLVSLARALRPWPGATITTVADLTSGGDA